MRSRSIFANLSFAVTVGIATYLTVSRFDADTPHRAGKGGAPRSGPPSETYKLNGISLARWLSILSQTFSGIRNDRILSVAAGVTFYGLLALFPTIAAVLSVYGLIADSQHLTELLAGVEGALPTAGVEFLRNRIERIDNDQEAAFSIALVISVVLSLWSANRGMKALFEGLNVAYGEIEKRTFVQLNITSIYFTMGLVFFLVIAIFTVGAVPILSNLDNLDTAVFVLIWIGRWPVVFVILLIGLELVYRFGPSRTGYRWGWISPGSILASLVWLMGSFLFSVFLANFQNYNMAFGTLAAVDFLLFWMWLSSISILIGAEFNGIGERNFNE